MTETSLSYYTVTQHLHGYNAQNVETLPWSGYGQVDPKRFQIKDIAPGCPPIEFEIWIPQD